MISPELLRRYPFFGFLTDAEQKALAMMSDEAGFADGEEIFKAGASADYLYFMLSGNASNYFALNNPSAPYKEVYAGEINPGELFGVSGLLEPYRYSTILRANGAVKAIRIDARALRAAFELDNKLGFEFMKALSAALMQRLQEARAQISQ